MAKINDFKKKIYSCECNRCKAVVWLVEERGAKLQFSPSRAGRLCELAVVAASGSEGILGADVVRERRAYAQHLGIQLNGPISNASTPIHIHWALEHSNHQTKSGDRINIGQARCRVPADW